MSDRWRPRAFAGWCIALALLWWLLTGGAASALPLGLVLVPACAWLGVRLAPAESWPLRPLALLRFAGFFLWQSLRAGLDVAGRILHPRLRIDPGFREVELRLPEGRPRRLLAQVLGLLPGTLSVRLDGARLLLHALDLRQDVTGETRRLERYIAALFGVSLPEEDGA